MQNNNGGMGTKMMRVWKQIMEVWEPNDKGLEIKWWGYGKQMKGGIRLDHGAAGF